MPAAMPATPADGPLVSLSETRTGRMVACGAMP
jgi:hypothetical protein